MAEDSLLLLKLLLVTPNEFKPFLWFPSSDSLSSANSVSSAKLLNLQFSFKFDVDIEVVVEEDKVEAPNSDVVVGFDELRLKKFMLFMMGGDVNVEV